MAYISMIDQLLTKCTAAHEAWKLARSDESFTAWKLAADALWDATGDEEDKAQARASTRA